MLKKLYALFALLLVSSMLLSACGAPAAEAPVAEAPAAVEEAPVAEAPVVEEAPAVMEMDWTAIYSEFIAGITADAKWYQTSPAALNEAFASGPIFVLDVREASEVAEKGYIEGSVNIPTKEVLFNLDKLPSLDTPFVVTCASGTRGNIVVIALRTLGYQVVNLSGGLSGWIAAEFPVVTGEPAAPVAGTAPEVDTAKLAVLQDLLANYPAGWAQVKPADLNAELANDVKPVIVDVRTPAEVETDGYIEGSVAIPLAEMFGRLGELPAEKDAPIVVTCKSGTRGMFALLGLQLNGYTNVRNLAGGVMGWKAAELPIAGAVDWMSVYGEFLAGITPEAKWYQTSAEALNESFAGTPPFILDIRETSEVAENGFIEGAINIPTKEVLANLDKLPGLDTPFVVTCASGHRGNIMTITLRLLGYQVTNLSGGFNGWKAAEYPVVTGEPAAPVAGAAPEVDATKLAKLTEFIANYPAGWATIKPADLNVELGNEVKPAVIDVRTPEETAETGVIEGSLLIPISELAGRVAELPADKAAPIVVTCKSGTRGTFAMLFLQLNGYSNVRNLVGGVSAWGAAELPLVK